MNTDEEYLQQHRESIPGKAGNRLVYHGADNLLGWRSPNDDVDRRLPFAPIADNRLTCWQQLFISD
ncbi:hypothetical protein NFL61_01900 [Enterobacter ludwigii]|uniref:hypothetical protein n=1 Tax=Enterobacter ludwigii TaxID=299767 RepID=UPI0024323543|nr:hypothetical protein [Enterobacter ludwigii]WGC20722.1 hypothetical protein NFL61_01900 [Enterobacter ludwigii]